MVAAIPTPKNKTEDKKLTREEAYDIIRNLTYEEKIMLFFALSNNEQNLQPAPLLRESI